MMYHVIALSFDGSEGYPLFRRWDGAFKTLDEAFENAFKPTFTQNSWFPHSRDIKLVDGKVTIESSEFYAEKLKYFSRGIIPSSPTAVGEFETEKKLFEATLVAQGLNLKTELENAEETWSSGAVIVAKPVLTLYNYLPRMETGSWPRPIPGGHGREFVDVALVGRRLLSARFNEGGADKFEFAHIMDVERTVDKYGFAPVWSYVPAGENPGGIAFIVDESVDAL